MPHISTHITNSIKFEPPQTTSCSDEMLSYSVTHQFST